MDQKENKELSLEDLEGIAGGTSARLPDGLAKRLTDRVKSPDLVGSMLISILSNVMLASKMTNEGVDFVVSKIKKELQEKMNLECSDDEIREYVDQHKGLV